MEEQKGKHISEFKEGEIISKSGPTLVPIEFEKNDLTGKFVPIRSEYNYSFIIIELIYRGIYNNQIHLEYTGRSKGVIAKVDYNLYQNGWIKCVPKERMLNKGDSQKFLNNIVDNYFN